jgi:hypothetical protein
MFRYEHCQEKVGQTKHISLILEEFLLEVIIFEAMPEIPR